MNHNIRRVEHKRRNTLQEKHKMEMVLKQVKSDFQG